MEENLIASIRRIMESMSTDDLNQILNKEDKSEFSEERYEAIRRILSDKKSNPLGQEHSKTVTERGYVSTYGTAWLTARIASFIESAFSLAKDKGGGMKNLFRIGILFIGTALVAVLYLYSQNGRYHINDRALVLDTRTGAVYDDGKEAMKAPR